MTSEWLGITIMLIVILLVVTAMAAIAEARFPDEFYAKEFKTPDKPKAKKMRSHNTHLINACFDEDGAMICGNSLDEWCKDCPRRHQVVQMEIVKWR